MLTIRFADCDTLCAGHEFPKSDTAMYFEAIDNMVRDIGDSSSLDLPLSRDKFERALAACAEWRDPDVPFLLPRIVACQPEDTMAMVAAAGSPDLFRRVLSRGSRAHWDTFDAIFRDDALELAQIAAGPGQTWLVDHAFRRGAINCGKFLVRKYNVQPSIDAVFSGFRGDSRGYEDVLCSLAGGNIPDAPDSADANWFNLAVDAVNYHGFTVSREVQGAAAGSRNISAVQSLTGSTVFGFGEVNTYMPMTFEQAEKSPGRECLRWLVEHGQVTDIDIRSARLDYAIEILELERHQPCGPGAGRRISFNLPTCGSAELSAGDAELFRQKHDNICARSDILYAARQLGHEFAMRAIKLRPDLLLIEEYLSRDDYWLAADTFGRVVVSDGACGAALDAGSMYTCLVLAMCGAKMTDMDIYRVIDRDYYMLAHVPGVLTEDNLAIIRACGCTNILQEVERLAKMKTR